MRRLLPSLVATTIFLASIGSYAETVQAHHARVELVSSRSIIVPGQRLWLGLHFSLEKDWHIYWINPGDSGQPPVLQWQLPPGFSAGAIEWPLPEKLRRSTLADYGYQDDVVLLVPIEVADSVKSGDKAELTLHAKWLICSDVCIPDHAELHLVLSTAAAASQDSTQAAIFAEARKRLPRPWPRSWKVSAVSEKDSFVVTIVAGKPISSAEFFPLVADQIENAAPQTLQTTPAGAKINLKKSDQLLQPIRVLHGLLVVGGGESYRFDAPVTNVKPKVDNN